MSIDWVKDINEMHAKFGVHEWVAKKVQEKDFETIMKFLRFRIDFLKEELTETELAYENTGGVNAEEVVDGLIDLCVVAIGTLDAMNVNAYLAWDEIHKANMSKEPGVKPSRPNPLGLPDLIKPEGWVGPDHTGNHGVLAFLE